MAILGYIVNKSRPTLLRLILIRLRHLESQKKTNFTLSFRVWNNNNWSVCWFGTIYSTAHSLESSNVLLSAHEELQFIAHAH